jgi:hypothetical protein
MFGALLGAVYVAAIVALLVCGAIYTGHRPRTAKGK